MTEKARGRGRPPNEPGRETVKAGVFADDLAQIDRAVAEGWLRDDPAALRLMAGEPGHHRRADLRRLAIARMVRECLSEAARFPVTIEIIAPATDGDTPTILADPEAVAEIDEWRAAQRERLHETAPGAVRTALAMNAAIRLRRSDPAGLVELLGGVGARDDG